MAQLLETVDDCGLSAGISHVAAALHEKGIVSAVSVLSNFPASGHAFALFSQYPTLEMGVHLNLTEGLACYRPGYATALTDASGRFRSRFHLFGHGILGKRDYLNQVETELDAQLRRMVDRGILPGHLSTHMHFHLVPALREIVLGLAQRYGIPRIRTYDPLATMIPFKSHVPFRLTHAHTLPGVDVTEHLTGVYFWRPFKPGWLSSELVRLPGTAEIVVHAGQRDDPTFPAGVPYSPGKRAAETRYIERVFSLLAADTTPA